MYWVQNSPTPYNAGLFRALTEGLRPPLTVFFTRPSSGIHPWRSDMRSGYRAIDYRRTLGVDWSLVSRVCRDSRSLFVTNCWQDPTSEIILLWLMLRRRPYLVWNDTPAQHRRRNLLKRVLRQAFLSLVFRRSAGVMGMGRLALEVFEKMGCPHSKLVNLPCFVDVDEFRPSDKQVLRQPVVFGSCGRLSPEKGVDLALKALARLSRSSALRFHYYIAGDGPELSSLERLAGELGIRAFVTFVRWLEPDQLAPFYRSIDVMLNPSRWEAYGVAVLEGMASGALVIASDGTAAAIDRIRHGENGFVHGSDSVEALEATILEVLRHSGERLEHIRREARHTAEQWPFAVAVNAISELLSRTESPAQTGNRSRVEG